MMLHMVLHQLFFGPDGKITPTTLKCLFDRNVRFTHSILGRAVHHRRFNPFNEAEVDVSRPMHVGNVLLHVAHRLKVHVARAALDEHRVLGQLAELVAIVVTNVVKNSKALRIRVAGDNMIDHSFMGFRAKSTHATLKSRWRVQHDVFHHSYGGPIENRSRAMATPEGRTVAFVTVLELMSRSQMIVQFK